MSAITIVADLVMCAVFLYFGAVSWAFLALTPAAPTALVLAVLADRAPSWPRIFLATLGSAVLVAVGVGLFIFNHRDGVEPQGITDIVGSAFLVQGLLAAWTLMRTNLGPPPMPT